MSPAPSRVDAPEPEAAGGRRAAAGPPGSRPVARLGLAAVFAIASLAKIGNTEAMVRAVRAYQILPEGAVHPVAYALPYVELALAVLLLAGVATRLVAAVRLRCSWCCSSAPSPPPASAA